jgi:hypothetical protein
MMEFEYIPMGPLWPLGLLLRETGETGPRSTVAA